MVGGFCGRPDRGRAKGDHWAFRESVPGGLKPGAEIAELAEKRATLGLSPNSRCGINAEIGKSCCVPTKLQHSDFPIARTLAEIAQAIPAPVRFEREHDRVTAVSFRCAGEFYRLAPNIEGPWKLLNEDRRVPKRLRSYEHAERVAWRCVVQWVRAELALLSMDKAPRPGKPGFRRRWSALDTLVSVQKRAQLDWGERLE